MDVKLFKNPGREYGIKPFWFWNGDLNEAEIEVQIKEMAEKGIGGVFICARQGLKIPYLSEAWFDRVKFATATAVKYGLEVWLYDEYPYPSGMSGGEVTLQHPDAKQNHLVQRFEEVVGKRNVDLRLPWAKVISALAAPKDQSAGKYLWDQALDLRKFIGNYQAEEVFQKTGLTKYNDKRYFTYGPQKRLIWQVPEGEFAILISMEQEISDFKYYGTFLDPCHEEAVATFIQTTHERYWETLGEYFGGAVKGMFSDEVGLLGSLPWSTRLGSFFKAQNGYELSQRMPALFDRNYNNAAKIRYDFFQSIHLLFRASYHEKISRWCQKHQIQYATEVPSVRMATQQYSHIPGGDSAHEKLGRSLEWILDEYTHNLRANPKFVTSLARQLDRKFAMTECFHSVGWSMTLQDAKWMIDRLAAYGINFYNFHAFYFTVDGLAKHDAPPSQFLQNPYWKHYRKLSDYVSRLSYLLSESTAMTEIAILDPTTTFWTHLGNPFQGFNYGGNDAAEKERLGALKRDWVYICKTLLMNQIDYDHIDGEILAEAKIEAGKFLLGKAVYSVLILPPLSNLETVVWKKIKLFLESGGTVIALGTLPYETIDETADIPGEMDEWFSGVRRGSRGNGGNLLRAYFIPAHGSFADQSQGEALLKLLNEVYYNKTSVRFMKGNRRGYLMQQRKMNDGTEIIWLANQEGDHGEITLSVAAAEAGIVFEKLDLETGVIYPLDFVRQNHGYDLTLQFGPYEAQLVRVVHSPKEKTVAQVKEDKTEPYQLLFDASENWSVAPQRDNVLRLGRFEFAIDAEDQGLEKRWQDFADGSHWPAVEPKTFIDQCSDFCQSESYHVTFKQDFGIPMQAKLSYPAVVWYRSQFKIQELPKAAKLLMESGAVSGAYTIYLNGVTITPADFNFQFYYDCQNKTCDITKWLREGVNYLAVRVVAEKDWDGLISPLYIIGPFGVFFGDQGMQFLDSSPQSVKLEGGYIQGYPYYAGELSFKRQFKMETLPDAAGIIFGFEHLDHNLHDCIELVFNGQTLGVRPWSPYLWQGAKDLLKLGDNEIEVKLVNTLICMFDGKFFDYDRHQLQDIK